jgi:hypothetical protein
MCDARRGTTVACQRWTPCGHATVADRRLRDRATPPQMSVDRPAVGRNDVEFVHVRWRRRARRADARPATRHHRNGAARARSRPATRHHRDGAAIAS